MRTHGLLCGLTALLALAGCPREQGKGAAPDTRAAAAADLTPPSPPLEILEVSFAGPAGHRPDSTFSRGEVVTCLFTVTGFTYHKGRVHVVADVRVLSPDGELELSQPGLELLNGKAPTATPGSIRGAATLNLSAAISPGSHTVELKVRDLLGRRQGSGRGSFTVPGDRPSGVKHLTLLDLRGAAELKVPPGAALPLTFEVAGFKTGKGSKGNLRRIDLGITANLEDRAGQRISSQTETLLKTELLFAPARHPVEHVMMLPAEVGPGWYRVALSVHDRIGGGRSTGLVRFQVVPRRLGIFNLHVHDAAAIPRSEFRLGEQAFVRLSVHGLRQSKAGEVDAEVDLAIVGPGGVYLARKKAAAVSGPAGKSVARAGRYPVELPLVLPALCPAGKYRLVIRARDRLARRETVREQPITITGKAPASMSSFKVDRLDVQNRPDLPPSKGDTFVAGKAYHLTLRVGGAKLEEPRKRTFRAKITGDLKLRRGGAVVHHKQGLFSFERTLTYRPLRIVLSAKWDVPADLAGGLYDLEVVALDRLDDRVSQMVRRVEIVRSTR